MARESGKVRKAWGFGPRPDGYQFTPYPPELFEFFERHELPPASRLVLVMVVRKWRFEARSPWIAISLPELSRMTGFSEPHCSKTLSKLVRERLLEERTRPGRTREVSLSRLLWLLRARADRRHP